MEKFQFDRNTHRLFERGIAAISKLANELERLNDNLEALTGDDVEEDD